MQIPSHIQAGEFLNSQEPVLGYMHQLMKDKLRIQLLMENHDIVECYRAHGGKVGQVHKAQLLKIGVKGRIVDTLSARLQDADAL